MFISVQDVRSADKPDSESGNMYDTLAQDVSVFSCTAPYSPFHIHGPLPTPGNPCAKYGIAKCCYVLQGSDFLKRTIHSSLMLKAL